MAWYEEMRNGFVHIYLSMPVELVPLAVVQHVRKGGSGQLLLTI